MTGAGDNASKLANACILYGLLLYAVLVVGVLLLVVLLMGLLLFDDIVGDLITAAVDGRINGDKAPLLFFANCASSNNRGNIRIVSTNSLLISFDIAFRCDFVNES